MPDTIELLDSASRDDLRQYLERLVRSGLPEVRIVVRGAVAGVFGCTQAPDGLLDAVPVVLVLRSFALQQAPSRDIDAVFTARSILDRLARLGSSELRLDLPDAESTAAWAGVLPPAHGWVSSGAIDSASLRGVAQEGMRRIADALPDSPGEAVVKRLRRSVWGAPIAPGVPAAAAFALEAMGFIPAREDRPAESDVVRVSATLTWHRLSSEHGEVLVRTLLG